MVLTAATVIIVILILISKVTARRGEWLIVGVLVDCRDINISLIIGWIDALHAVSAGDHLRVLQHVDPIFVGQQIKLTHAAS